MKKLLLGTTALVGASFMATAAMAAPQIKVGGSFEFQVGITSQDIDNFGPSPGGFSSVTNERGYGFVQDAEIVVRASDKLDSGLAWAVKIEIEAATDESDGDQADEAAVTLSGSWGRLVFGSDDGPVDTMKIGAKTAVTNAGSGGTGGNFRRWVGWNTVNPSLHDNDMDVTDSGDAIKIMYHTPRIAGFQAGVSFVPGSADTSQDRFSDGANFSIDTDLVASAQENYVELGLGFDQTFDQVRVRVSGVYSHAEAQNVSTSSGYEDVRAWGVGAAVTFGGFTIGAGYANDGKSNMAKGVTNTKVDSWGVGLGYNMGAWDFGLSYYQSKAGANSRSYAASGLSGDDKLRVASGGVSYDLGAGVTLFSELSWFETETSTSATLTPTQSVGNNSGYTLISGIVVEF